MKCKHCNGRDFDTKSAGSTGLYICRGCGSSTADRPIVEFRDSTPDNETADAEPFALDPTPPAPDPAAERRARLAMLADRAAKPITGRPVDTTGDLFDSSRAPAPLFACPTPRASVAQGGSMNLQEKIDKWEQE